MYLRKVPSEGDLAAKIAIIGEMPGDWEERKLRPFYPEAPAGGVLEQCLHAAGLIRSDVFLLNVFPYKFSKVKGVIKDENGVVLYTESKGFTEGATVYLEELREELARLEAPAVLVPMGNPALRAITEYTGILKRRGSFYRYNGIPVVPSIHPAATLRSGNYLYRYYMVHDLKRAAAIAAGEDKSPPKQGFKINPAHVEALNWLKWYQLQGLKGERINFDIELVNHEISCISFSTEISEAVSVPFHRTWTAIEETQIWSMVQAIMEEPKIVKVNQNIIFDAFVLGHKNGVHVAGRLDDPMVANHIIYPDFPKGLDFLTSVHTTVPYYKDEGKTHGKEPVDRDRFYRYNCQDSAVSIECMDVLDLELDKKGHRDTYERTVRMYPALLAMMLGGIPVNKEALKESQELVGERIKETQEELNTLVGRELNVNSAKQLIQYFYIEKGIKPYLNRKTGRPTCDDKALARLAKGTKSRPGLQEASLIQRVRGDIKLKSTYLDIQFDADGRFRCSYNPRGTVSGRLSSSKTIFGTGMNHQNLPPEFQQFMVPDPGYIFIEADKRQAEWVITAYAANDARMIETIEKGLDPHARTGELITGLNYDIILQEDKVIGHETNPDTIRELRGKSGLHLEGVFLPRTMGVRQMGKKSNHGLNYGMGYKRFALENEVDETEAKKVVEGYHGAYPGLRGNYYNSIQYQLGLDRTLTNCFGRKRTFLDRWGPELFNAAYDFIPQSTVADLINGGMIAIYEDKDSTFTDLWLLAQRHDSLLFQFPYGNVFELLKCMEGIKSHLDPVMEYHGREFRIATDFKIGFNGRDMHEVRTHKEVQVFIQKMNKRLE